MRKIWPLLLILFFYSPNAYAQSSNATYSRIIGVQFSSTPTGGCSAGQVAIDSANGVISPCIAGAWVTPSGGGGFTAAGDLSGNGTSQTVIGINNTLLSGLPTGIPLFTAGVPTIISPTNCTTNWGQGINASGNEQCTSSVTGNITVGSLATNSDGVHPSSVQLVGNTTLPSLTGNTVTLLGFPAATNTAWSFQFPTAIPTTNHILGCTVSGTNCLLSDLGAIPSGGGGGVPFGPGAGSVNVMTVTTNTGTVTNATGQIVNVLTNLANTTTTPTLNVDGAGAQTIEKIGDVGALVALVNGDYGATAGASYYTFISNGTNWILQNPQTPNVAGIVAAAAINTAGGVGIGASQGFTFNGRSGIFSPADGKLEFFNNAATGFTQFQFGGASSSFPAFGISGTTITAQLADASAGAPFSASTLTSTVATGTAPLTVTSTTPVANFTASNHPTEQFCGTTTTCSHTAETGPKIVFGSAPLVSGTPSAATVTGISPAFTATADYVCTVSAPGASAATALLGVTNVSASSFTITGPASVTTVISYICVGF